MQEDTSSMIWEEKGVLVIDMLELNKTKGNTGRPKSAAHRREMQKEKIPVKKKKTKK